MPTAPAARLLLDDVQTIKGLAVRFYHPVKLNRMECLFFKKFKYNYDIHRTLRESVKKNCETLDIEIEALSQV